MGLCVAKKETVVPRITKQNKLIRLPVENQSSNNHRTPPRKGGSGGGLDQLFLINPFKK